MLKGLAIDVSRVEPVEAPESAEETRQLLEARAGLYRLLAGVFVEEPGREFLEALRRPEALASLAEAGVSFDADFLEPGLDQLIDALSTEFTTLFAASGGFPPVESVRLTGRYQQDPLFTVREDYRRAGFKALKGRFAVFEDQLGMELLFIAEMLESCARALDCGDRSEYNRLTREVKRFWTLHLGKWVRGYCGLVQRATEHSFYREMAKFLEAFAGEEIALLKLRIEDTDQGREIVPKSEIQVLFNPDEPVCNACGENTDAQGGARA
ncbi:MAG: molecular chaperone TorD family protein [Betaproteobacteria bacterium]|nr:molecular chaperone TorD family protein [Betaproteobacteria bacterium]